ncbi:hypothetical protein ACFVJI_11110 [Streptomyces sp. NPDC127584]|uniref:hypothetical protein n=1 Tax=Streptomyces sp. NPDC127584 TaxID=3345403 RepID=UPI003629714E
MSLRLLPLRPVLTAVAVPVLLLAVACSPSPPEASAERYPTADLDRFHRQHLSFGSCAGYATTPADEKLLAAPGLRCARLAAPLAYATPGGEEARIAVLRVPARGTSKGPLLLNSGGPGGSDPHLGGERRLSQYAGFQSSFDTMAAACAKDESCPLGTGPERATEAFQALARPLLDAPIAYGDGPRSATATSSTP